MLWQQLLEVYEAWEQAEGGNKKFLAHYSILLKVSELMPVLEMLMDYTKNNKAHAEGMCKEYESIFDKEFVEK